MGFLMKLKEVMGAASVFMTGSIKLALSMLCFSYLFMNYNDTVNFMGFTKDFIGQLSKFNIAAE